MEAQSIAQLDEAKALLVLPVQRHSGVVHVIEDRVFHSPAPVS
jgi:hypothetical protein